MGNTWCFPIHLGIIYATTADLYLKDRSIKQLKYWQEKNAYRTMIGPHIGLPSDYDEFLIWGAGGLFGILSSLFSDNHLIRMYFATQLIKIINKTQLDFKLPNLLWLYHIIPSNNGSKRIFNFITKHIKEVGDFSMNLFWIPPFLNQEEYFENEKMTKDDKLPSFEEFITLITSKKKLQNSQSIQLPCSMLSNKTYDEEIVEKMIAAI